MNIITNNVPRDIIYGIDLTEKEKKEFDYYSPEELVFASFVRYKDWVYDLGEFILTPKDSDLSQWNGYATTSYFSGILVRYLPDHERVIMGRYYT